METQHFQTLKETLAEDLQVFLNQYESEEVFAVAVHIGQLGFGYSIGTGSLLQRMAKEEYKQYKEKHGERFLLSEEEIAMLGVEEWTQHRLYASIENLKVYLKWNSLDDWKYEDFGGEKGPALYDQLIIGVDKMEIGSFLEEQIILCLKELLLEGVINGEQYYWGTSFGEDEHDFLRSASMLHSYKRVKELWKEHWMAQELYAPRGKD